VDVAPGGNELRLVARRQPTLDVAFDGEAPESVRILLRDRHWSALLDEPVHVPAEADAWVRVDVGGGAYVAPIGPVGDGVRRARIALPGRKTLRFPQVAAEGADVRLSGGALEWPVDAERWSEPDAPAVRDTRAVGPHWLVVEAPGLGRAVRRVDLPWASGATIEIDGLVFERAPEPKSEDVVVRDELGRLVTDAYVDALEVGRYAARPPLAPTSDEPFRDGTHVRVARPGCVASWARLRGDPPYTVTVGCAAVEIVVPGADRVRAIAGGDTVDPGEDGVLVVGGLPAGTHEILVGADGFAPRVVRVHVAAGETRRIRLPLRPRPEVPSPAKEGS
jgi:hypothetical protein